MAAFILTALIGVVCIVIGITNLKGDVSSLHAYHRNRVSEKDMRTFGKLVGSGTIIVGAGCILFGGLSAVASLTQVGAWMLVGVALLILCLLVGLGISFFAMIKYNKGIF